VDERLRQEIVDDEHLKLLRIGYFITGGITALASMFVLLYALFFFFILRVAEQQPAETAPPTFVFWIIGLFGVGFTLALLTIAVLQFVTGQRLKQRRSRMFCMIIAAITCVHIPYGTLLGIGTFLVLGRPTTQEMFEGTTRAADTSAS